MRVWSLCLLVACEGTTADAFPRACDQSEIDGDCRHFTGLGWTEEDVADACDEGAIVETCPPNAIGRCTTDGGLSFETQSYLYPAFYPGNDGSRRCGQLPDSTWTIL